MSRQEIRTIPIDKLLAELSDLHDEGLKIVALVPRFIPDKGVPGDRWSSGEVYDYVAVLEEFTPEELTEALVEEGKRTGRL